MAQHQTMLHQEHESNQGEHTCNGAYIPKHCWCCLRCSRFMGSTMQHIVQNLNQSTLRQTRRAFDDRRREKTQTKRRTKGISSNIVCSICLMKSYWPFRSQKFLCSAVQLQWRGCETVWGGIEGINDHHWFTLVPAKVVRNQLNVSGSTPA